MFYLSQIRIPTHLTVCGLKSGNVSFIRQPISTIHKLALHKARGRQQITTIFAPSSKAEKKHPFNFLTSNTKKPPTIYGTRIAMSTKPENPRALPSSFDREGYLPSYNSGMSLRDWFAGQALAGIMSLHQDPAKDHTNLQKHIAIYCYRVADAMLAEREKERE
jgi:hypothetical protein